jgi:predicted nucleotidyltransferase
MSGTEILGKHKQEILAAAKENGMRNVRIFGSVARGEARIDSDINLLVEIEDDRTLFDLIRFKQTIEDIVGRKIDVISDQGLHETMRETIMNEVIEL